MNLKKNDQYIIIAAVAIIIIAGVGIAMYSPPEVEEITIDDSSDSDLSVFEVNSEIKEGTISEESFEIKNSLFSKWGSGSATINLGAVENLKDVEIKIDYTDNIKLWILFNDKFYATITDPSGGTNEDCYIQGAGNFTKSYTSINGKVSSSTIEAESRADAMEILESRYNSNWKNGEFVVDASLKVSGYFGFRILEKLIKDHFTVSVTYTYYDYDLVEQMDDDDDMTETGSSGDGGGDIPYMSMIINTGCARYI